MLKVHLDTDIGADIDDLCALAMLLNLPHVEITGITTTGEYRGLRAGLVRHILDLSRREIPVASGADITLHEYKINPWFLPLEKYWPAPITPQPGPASRALALLKQSIEQGAVLIGTGAYSNFALLERKYPGILAHARIVLMGGYIPFQHDQRKPLPWFVPEHNFQADPSSTGCVLQKAHPLFVPLNTTTKTALRKRHLPDLAQAGPLGALVAHQAKAYLDEFHFDHAYGGKCELPQDLINFQHDPLACAVATGWDKVTCKEYCFSWYPYEDNIICDLDPRGKRFSYVTEVQAREFDDYWVRTFGSFQLPINPPALALAGIHY